MQKIVCLLFVVITLSSCIPARKWQKATITMNDNSKQEMYVYASKYSYYNFVRAKHELRQYRKIYNPEMALSVEMPTESYYTLVFDEERFGIETKGFVKKIAGNSLYLAETKAKTVTCACKTSGGYFKAYLLVHGNNYIKLQIRNNTIVNIKELNEFISAENIDFEIPATIYSIEELASFINESGV